MPSHNHEVLKFKAVEWLYLNMKCKYIATEVKIGKYIYDVIGTDGSRIFIIEAKAELNDFLRELNKPEDIKNNIKLLKEEFKKDIDKKKYLENLEKERNKSIKFFDNIINKLSTHRYIIAPDGIISNDKIPDKWGLLNEEPRVIKKCSGNLLDNKKIIDKVIREICKRNTKLYLINNDVNFGKVIEFPKLELI